MLTKDKKARIIITLEAVALVLAMHLLLLVLFRSPNSDHIQEAPRSNRISLLPRQSPKFDRKAFDRWLVYADPTLIARPDESFGYSLLVASHGLRPNVKGIDIGRGDERFDFSRIVSKPSVFLRDSRLDRDYELPDFAYQLPVRKMAITFPLVVCDDGKMVQGLFSGEGVDEMMKTAGISGPSVIKLFREDSSMAIPRFQLLKSCGAPELDRLAIRTVVGNMGFVNGRTGDILLNVYWKPEDEGAI